MFVHMATCLLGSSFLTRVSIQEVTVLVLQLVIIACVVGVALRVIPVAKRALEMNLTTPQRIAAFEKDLARDTFAVAIRAPDRVHFNGLSAQFRPPSRALRRLDSIMPPCQVTIT